VGMLPLAIKMFFRGKLPFPIPKRTKNIQQVRALFHRFGKESK